MSNTAALYAFLSAAIVASLLWGRALWYCDERSQAVRRAAFFAMSFTRWQQREVRSLLLTVIYCALGLLAALLFAAAFGLDTAARVSVSTSHAGPVLLGVVAEISLAGLLVGLGRRVVGRDGAEQFAEVSEIPWMKGLRELPGWAVPLAAALATVVEEFMFRGVLLPVLTERLLVSPPLAVLIAGALFCLQQLVQVRTRFQAMVIGCACTAISLVGGLLVLLTQSVVPAILCHMSFVLFFMSRREGRTSGGLREVSAK